MRADPLALILAAAVALPAGADTIELHSRFLLDTESIMGVSGIEVSGDGLTFTAVGDQGFWIEGRFLRENGRLSNIELDAITPVLDYNGFPVAARRVGDLADAEGLAIAPDGRAWISFERWARVALYMDGRNDTATFIRDHETFKDHADNWQLEAIAISPGGTLYAFSEKPLPEGIPVYRLLQSDWTIERFLPERDLFAIVGADFDDNGDLYILERKLVMGFWWQSQIRRINFETDEDVTLWTSERGDFGNLEGISIWRTGNDLILTAVSDNNGSSNTPTEFIEFRLIESPDAPLDEVEPEG